MTDQPAAERLARATLLALRGAAGASPAVAHNPVVFLPEMRPHPLAAAVARLASSRKPVTIVGVVVNDWLYVGLWSGEDAGAYGPLSLLKETLREAAPLRVTVTSGVGEVVELTVDEFLTWIDEYRLPLATMDVRPDVGATSAGGNFIAQIGPPDRGFLNSVT